MDNRNITSLPQNSFFLYNAIRLKPVRIATLYALLSFGNCLLYWPGTTGLPGSPWRVFAWAGYDQLIGW